MNRIATFNNGAIEETFSFFKFESTSFDYFRRGCEALFSGIVEVDWTQVYRLDCDDFQDRVVLNRGIVGPDVTAEDIIMCGREAAISANNTRAGSTVFAAA